MKLVFINGQLPGLHLLLKNGIPIRLKVLLMLLFTYLIFDPHQASAQRVVTGKVVDASTQAPLPGATVHVNGTTLSSTTNALIFSDHH
jgi:hypothetical protein